MLFSNGIEIGNVVIERESITFFERRFNLERQTESCLMEYWRI